MRWSPVLLAAFLSAAPPATAAPPTVSRATTYYVEPLDAEGYVDYAAALDAAFGDADTAPQDNAFAGILQHLDTGRWDPEHTELLHKKIGIAPRGEGEPRFVPFDAYAVAHGLDEDAANQILEEIWYRAWTADEFPLAARWLDDTAPALDGIAEAIRRPNYFAPLVIRASEPVLFGALLPHLSSHRGIARSFSGRIGFNLAVGDLDAVVRDLLTLERFARLQTREPTVIASLVGVSMNAISCDVFSELLNDERLTLQHALAIRDALAELPPSRSMKRLVSEAERMSFLDLMQNARRGRVNLTEIIGMMQQVDAPLQATHVDNPTDAFGMLLRDPRFDFDRALRRVNTFWDQLEMLDGDTHEIQTHLERVEQAIESLRMDVEKLPQLFAVAATGIPADADADAITDKTADTLMRFFLPSLGSAVMTRITSDTFDQLETVGLALAIYRFDVGRFPETLAELVPDYLDAVPTDPFNPGPPGSPENFDQPLTYRPQDGGYLLYSFSRDLEDDGGLDDLSEGDLVLRVGAAAR